MGAKRVRALFQKARENSPSIIFLDELDSIAYKRKNDGECESERISTLNQLLTEMDGFQVNDKIVVIGATNRIKVLDPALLRAGRFDIKI